MDDIVKQAMAKWPNVPDCYGWMGLDARGNWYMRDDVAQAQGNFASGAAGAKGSLLCHDKLIAFIERNYAADAQGCWYFQNGPQRVYIELEATPWIWRVQKDFALRSHTGVETEYRACWTDEQGWVYLNTPLGFGLVHTQDVALVAQAIDRGLWSVQTVDRSELPMRYGYVVSPQRHSQATLQKK